MSNNNKSNSLQVLRFAIIICLVCSILVSVASVSLRGLQKQNVDNEKKINVLRAAGLVGEEDKLSSKQINQKFAQIFPVVVDLSSGNLVTDKNPLTYDMYEAARGKDGRDLTVDPAGIKRIAKEGLAYAVIDGNNISKVVFPVQGYGLWSTIYGFTALSFKDKQPEIAGLTFYQQAETPGLGARITEAGWRQTWNGKKPYDKEGLAHIVLLKRGAKADNEVDGIAGATLTGKGVESLMNFWLGEQGYRNFVKKILSGEISADLLKRESKIATTGKKEVN